MRISNLLGFRLAWSAMSSVVNVASLAVCSVVDIDIRLLLSTYYSVLKDRRYYLRPGIARAPEYLTTASVVKLEIELI